MAGLRRAGVRLLRILSALALAATALAAPVAVAGGDPCFRDLARPAVSQGNLTLVSIAACTFEPAITRVPVGATVTFRNASPQGHLVTGANMTWGSEKKTLGTGEFFTVRFSAAGVYPYTCMLHPGMTGAVIVGDAVGTALGAGTESPTSGEAGESDTGGAGSGNVGLIVGAGSLAALGGLALLVLRRRATEPLSESEPAR